MFLKIVARAVIYVTNMAVLFYNISSWLHPSHAFICIFSYYLLSGIALLIKVAFFLSFAIFKFRRIYQWHVKCSWRNSVVGAITLSFWD